MATAERASSNNERFEEQQGRRLPEHRRQAGSSPSSSATVSLEGPVNSRRLVTHRLIRRADGSMRSRLVQGEVMLRAGLVFGNPRHDIVRVRSGELDAIWARVDSDDWGRGKPGFGIFELVSAEDGQPFSVWVIDEEILGRQLSRNEAIARSQRLIIAER